MDKDRKAFEHKIDVESDRVNTEAELRTRELLRLRDEKQQEQDMVETRRVLSMFGGMFGAPLTLQGDVENGSRQARAKSPVTVTCSEARRSISRSLRPSFRRLVSVGRPNATEHTAKRLGFPLTDRRLLGAER